MTKARQTVNGMQVKSFETLHNCLETKPKLNDPAQRPNNISKAANANKLNCLFIHTRRSLYTILIYGLLSVSENCLIA